MTDTDLIEVATETEAPEVATPTGAGIPFMLTSEQKSQLADRGYSRKEISEMSPEEGHRVLAEPWGQYCGEITDEERADPMAAMQHRVRLLENRLRNRGDQVIRLTEQLKRLSVPRGPERKIARQKSEINGLREQLRRANETIDLLIQGHRNDIALLRAEVATMNGHAQ